MLHEATWQQPWYDITTGLIEGWQRFDDDIRREQDHPLLSVKQWDQVLRAVGFTDVVCWPEAGSPAAILGLHVIVAQPLHTVASDEVDQPIDVIDRDRSQPDRTTEQAPASELLDQLRAALPDERLDQLVEFVCQHVSRILRLDPNEALDRRARLMDIGVDSLMAVELRSRLTGGLGLAQTLPATLIFDYPTVEAIAVYLLRDVLNLAEVTPAPSTPIEAAATNSSEIEDLSDDEVAALLLKKLRSLS